MNACLARLVSALFVLMAGLSCGLQPVELRPSESVTGADELQIGEVPAAAIARLQAQRSEQGDEALQVIYPAPAGELVVPADLAPMTIEWRAGKKPGAMPMAPDMLMPDMAMPMGMAAMMMDKGMGPAPQPGAAGRVAPPPAAPAQDAMDAPKADKVRNDQDRIVAYEVNVHGQSMGLRVYVAAASAALPYARWSELLRAHSGGTLTIDLRGVTQAGAIVHAAPLKISVRADMPAGVFYSFSPTSQGLTRARLSDTHDTRMSVPLTDDQGARCVGCHVVSSDGKRMLAATAAPSQLHRWPLLSDAALGLTWPTPSAAASNAPDYVRGTFDRAATRIAAAQAGKLVIFDADSGELLEQSAAPLSAAVYAPDWSPDGRSIVLQVGDEEPAPGMQAPRGLASVQVGLDGRLSELMPLVSSGEDELLREPRYSPDGEWVVYEQRVGSTPMRDARESKLFIVRAAGGEPIELRALAEGAGPSDARAPAFAPADQPGHVYLLFSSRRAVGSFVPAEGQRQLFASELDLSLAASGEDPSHAAFWLPFQQRTNSYLQGQWGPALQACTPSSEVCDGVDDNCNGKVDDDCRMPAAESCGNGSDDDSDGAVDEGCSCAFLETCGNQLGDDCDLRTDEQPCMPGTPMKP